MSSGGEAVPEEKTEAEIQAEIQSVFRQITASVTFLPMLDGNCTFNVLVYADADSDVPLEWGDSDAKEIENGEKVQLRSFSSSNHRVDTLVSYRYVESNTAVHVLGLIIPDLAISLIYTNSTCIRWQSLSIYLPQACFYPVFPLPRLCRILTTSIGSFTCSRGNDGLRSVRHFTAQDRRVSMFSIHNTVTSATNSAKRMTQ